MIARLFILVFAPPVVIARFCFEVLCGIVRAFGSATNAVGVEITSIKRHWVAASLKLGDE